MTFATIRTRCAQRFRDPNHQVITDSAWKDYVNERYRRVIADASAPPWSFLQAQTTVTILANTHSIALPTGWNSVTAVWNQTDKFPMNPLEGTRSYIVEFPNQAESGPPQLYLLRGANIEGYPSPTYDTTLRLDGYVAPADMSGDSDVPAFQAQFHEILVVGAVADAYLDDGADIYKVYEQEYQDILKKMHQFYETVPRNDRYPEIVDNWYG